MTYIVRVHVVGYMSLVEGFSKKGPCILGGVYTTPLLYEYGDFGVHFHRRDVAFTRSHFISGS